MAQAEQPERLRPQYQVSVDDVRQLMGASTPHFALQLRNRIRTLIAGLPAGRPGPPPRRAGDRPARAPRRHRRDPRRGLPGRPAPAAVARRGRADAARRGTSRAGGAPRASRAERAPVAPRRDPPRRPPGRMRRPVVAGARRASGRAGSRGRRCGRPPRAGRARPTPAGRSGGARARLGARRTACQGAKTAGRRTRVSSDARRPLPRLLALVHARRSRSSSRCSPTSSGWTPCGSRRRGARTPSRCSGCWPARPSGSRSAPGCSRSPRAPRRRPRWPPRRSTCSPAGASGSGSACRARRSPRAGTACRSSGPVAPHARVRRDRPRPRSRARPSCTRAASTASRSRAPSR